jgi:hypothetical protein
MGRQLSEIFQKKLRWYTVQLFGTGIYIAKSSLKQKLSFNIYYNKAQNEHIRDEQFYVTIRETGTWCFTLRVRN